jgi:hypothetical protein
MRLLMLALLCLLLTGCAMSGAGMSDEARCVHDGGKWGGNGCDPGGGGGGGGGY